MEDIEDLELVPEREEKVVEHGERFPRFGELKEGVSQSFYKLI